MKKLFIFAAIIFSFLVSSPAFACQPCAKTLNLEETIKKADLIIVGQKVADGPRSDFGEGYGGSDWIEVKIIETLKDSAPSAKIKVNSWDTMCPYGIIVNDSRNYLMLLQKRISSEESYQYDAVDFGCAETSYLVENNQINFNGQEIYLKAFASKYGLAAPKKLGDKVSNDGVYTKDLNRNNAQKIDTNKDNVERIDTTYTTNNDTSQKQSLILYIIITLAILVLLIFVALKLIKRR